MSDNSLENIYHNPVDPGSLGGANRFYRRAKQLKVNGVSRSSVNTFLKGQQAYTLHKPARKKYLRNHIYVAGIDSQWQADLADMQSIAKQNDGARYLLTVIDVFSKFAWVEPVTTKNSNDVICAFKKILKTASPRKPRRLQTDKGKEFLNSLFSQLTKQHGIHHFATDSDQKAAVVERFNRTIKTRIWTYLSDRGTVRWIDVVQNLVKAYNLSHHRTIGMAPAHVKKFHENELWTRMYGDGNTYLKPLIPVGSMVRISKQKALFDKGYIPKWSKEHFTVSKVSDQNRRGTKREVYKIVDYNGDPINGSWYSDELQRITDNQYRIERVLRRRTAPDGTRELYVKWEGWPAKFNLWISENEQFDVARR